jgi:tRNA (adenine57-N1/adenine58-N1)-methyltransferase
MLACWVPTTPQLDTLGAAVRAEPLLVEARTSEILQRYWHVAYNSVRPDHRMVGHTGFLMTAWRLAEIDEPEVRADSSSEPPGAEGEASPTEGKDEPSLPAASDHDNNPDRESP